MTVLYLTSISYGLYHVLPGTLIAGNGDYLHIRLPLPYRHLRGTAARGTGHLA